MDGKSIFVTVGTTKFEELCETIVSAECLRAVRKLGYSKVCLQAGAEGAHPHLEEEREGVLLTIYKYKDTIAEDMRKADLVISHAGAGTILEALDMGKSLLVVINTNLMDNHQLEIAEQLHIEQHLYYCTCETLIDTFETAHFSSLRPYPKADTAVFYEYLNNFMGLKRKK